MAGVLAAGCGTVAANPGGPNKPAADAASTRLLRCFWFRGFWFGEFRARGGPPRHAGADRQRRRHDRGGRAACSGWPANAPHGKLTALFTPVAVERCVSSVQQITGKGEWLTATLERSTDRLATLTAALMAPSERQPNVMSRVRSPPAAVLFNSAGEELIPRLPVGACGSINSEVLGTLAR